MQATTHTPSRPRAFQQTGLIAAAILAAAALAVAAVRFEMPAQAPHGTAQATLPVSAVIESAIAGDPSVPRASAVFRASGAAVEELPPTF